MFLRVAAVALLVLAVAAAALPSGRGLASVAWGTSCSGWTSETRPPRTIRVLRVATGEVQVVRFRRYAKNVLSREWIPSWTRPSLRAGALVVRNYAWYQVLHWRGGANGDGECYDVRDDVRDQVFDPSKPIYRRAAAAVDAMWDRLLHRGGAVFPTYYAAGAVDEPCGANANGVRAWQWGTQACGRDGLTPAEIVTTYYYPDVEVIRPTPTPTPTSTPTPMPSPPPTLNPSVSPTPSPSVSPAASG
jgi:hypothetical protein